LYLDEGKEYQLNERKSRACLKYIGSEDYCEEMMNNLRILHQDETLDSKRLKRPAAKAAKQAEK
jgi:hypothetical protein